MLKSIALFAALGGVCHLAAQTEPQAGQWMTWVIPSGAAYRVPPPPDTAATAAELAAMKDSTGDSTSPDLAAIRYWDAGAPGYHWMQLAQQLAVNGGLAAPLQTRALALVAVAIYDATVAAWDSKYAYMRPHPIDIDRTVTALVTPPAAPSYPSEHAAAAGAAAAVLAYLFPDQAASVAELANRAGASRILAGVAFPSDVAAGRDLGNRVGQAVIAFAKADGSSQPFTGSFPPAPGVWDSPTPVAPLAGNWRPWVLDAASEYRPPAPPVFGSADANAQYAAVKNLQRANSTNHLAWFWQPGFFQPWLQQDEIEIFQNHLDSNPPHAARVYALQTIAQHDATLGCWDAKYAYLELRPPQADPAITPVFALPQHPGYPSGHACASGASATVLGALFPDDSAALASMANDAGTSTFDAEIHTPLDVSAGLTLGQQVGKETVERAKVEPADQ